ncbi:flagellar export chaperone FlgN [Parvibium lacunae]|uniref:Flagellar protein FlgN n=1 Tax=Parvibium lacunae TaxID=1888893 RepID=A0A368L3R9_9BURK|nr:flagellar export chaperone FlgN [Parvibium lacunae]RCS58204.1 hypothetical protein DU000_05100 [Parvibium lacunae]
MDTQQLQQQQKKSQQASLKTESDASLLLVCRQLFELIQAANQLLPGIQTLLLDEQTALTQQIPAPLEFEALLNKKEKALLALQQHWEKIIHFIQENQTDKAIQPDLRQWIQTTSNILARPALGRQLTQALDKLQLGMQEIVELNQLNGQLIVRQRHQVEQSLHILRGTDNPQLPSTPLYTPTGGAHTTLNKNRRGIA